MADTEKENSSAESKKKSAMLDEDFGKKSRKCADSNASDCSFKHVKNQDSRSNSETSTDAFKDLENKKPLMPSHQNGSMTESIDRDTDHQGWLQLKKRKRREIPEERKRRRLGNRGKPSQAVGATKLPQSVSSCRRDQDKNGVSLFFRKHEFPLIMSHWQIIQLVSSTHPGRFFAWVIADGIMNKISITVPRVFYLNSKTPVTEEFPGRRVNKILPHSRPVFNLTEICIDEDLFRAESRKLAIHLAVPEVEGIYETKVPLEFNAILQIGCVCKVDKTARVRNVQDGWNMSELQMKTTAECSYLEKGIPFFYLYHSFLEGRGIYIAYIAVSSTISAIVVDPFQNKELSSSLLEKQFHEACQALSIDPPAPGSCITFKVDYVKSIEAGEQHLQRALTEFRVKNSGPTVGLIESPNFQSIKSAIRVLDDFPCVSIPCNARDSCYQVLGWQVTAGKIGMQRCAASSQWFNERVLLSRALRDQQQILWTSDDGIPDLGGIFEGDTCFVDEVSQLAFTYPGAYRRVVVELKIHHLAVNALLKSSQIEEMEGVSLFGYDHEMHSGSHVPESDFDETTSCAPAFRELKRLIRRCISDAVTSENVFADAILQHLYRWLCSPLSKLHDPALHRVLHKVMEKIFAHLLVELQKLGATLIFANFSKIIIDTVKIDLPAAHEHCYSLLKNLKSRDLFERIKLEPLHFWHYFLFMDLYNYGGIQAKITTGSDVEITEDESQVETVLSWNIAEYLPKETQDHFILIASEFMYKPWKYSREQIRMRMATTVGNTFTPSAESLEASVTEYLKDQVSSYFTQKLSQIVEDTLHHSKGKKKIDEGDSKNRGLPQMSDSNPYKGDAALEFIKHVCAVLSLDHNVQHDILVNEE